MIQKAERLYEFPDVVAATTGNQDKPRVHHRIAFPGDVHGFVTMMGEGQDIDSGDFIRPAVGHCLIYPVTGEKKTVTSVRDNEIHGLRVDIPCQVFLINRTDAENIQRSDLYMTAIDHLLIGAGRQGRQTGKVFL